jgi:hypothetical protein
MLRTLPLFFAPCRLSVTGWLAALVTLAVTLVRVPIVTLAPRLSPRDSPHRGSRSGGSARTPGFTRARLHFPARIDLA